MSSVNAVTGAPRGRRARRATPFALVLVRLAGAVGPAAAHLKHLATDGQTTDDAVLMEVVYTASDGPWHVVVHADDGGHLGEPAGHRTVESGFVTALDGSYQSGAEGTATVTATEAASQATATDGARFGVVAALLALVATLRWTRKC